VSEKNRPAVDYDYSIVYNILILLICCIVNREVPQVEVDAVANFLRHLLTAEVDELPTATLVHRFWTQFGDRQTKTKTFKRCLKRHRLHRVKCYGITRDYCGWRFGEKSPARVEHCRRLLANEINTTSAELSTSTIQIFRDYRSCFRSYRHRVDAHCTELLRRAISDHPLRATKVVRATMDSMGPLLHALPTLRVIHLVRDPRSVTLSRNTFGPAVRGIYTKRTRNKTRLVAEASLYCHHVTADIRSRLELEREFPGRTMWMTYEDVMANPEQKFRHIYELLDEPVPTETLKKMQRMAAEGQTRNVTTKWQKVLTPTDEREILYHCSEFFQLIGVSSEGSPLT